MKQDEQMIEALRDLAHGLHLARMALVGEALALRLAGRKAEREKVWASVLELTAQIEVTTRELAEHMAESEGKMEEKFWDEMRTKISELTADMSEESAIGFVDYLIEELRIYAKGLGER